MKQARAKFDEDYEKASHFIVLSVSDDKYHTIEDVMDDPAAIWE